MPIEAKSGSSSNTRKSWASRCILSLDEYVQSSFRLNESTLIQIRCKLIVRNEYMHVYFRSEITVGYCELRIVISKSEPVSKGIERRINWISNEQPKTGRYKESRHRRGRERAHVEVSNERMKMNCKALDCNQSGVSMDRRDFCSTAGGFSTLFCCREWADSGTPRSSGTRPATAPAWAFRGCARC